MATIRIDKKKSGHYMSLIHSYRDENGVARMKTLANLGKAEDYNPETLKKMGSRLYALGGGNPLDLMGTEVEEVGRFNFGYVQLVDSVLHTFKLDQVFARIKRKHHLTFDLYEAVLLMLVERFNVPNSKLANYHNQAEYYSVQDIKLHWLYRALDKLDQYSHAIQQSIYMTGRNLFNQKLDIVFYDVTTFYFDSDVEQENTLRKKGYSKDGKIGKTQVVLGMLMDRNKQPVAYHIFEGNTAEVKTISKILEQVKKQYSIDKVIVVADRAMLSEQNIDLISGQMDFPFIFGEKLKMMKTPAKEALVDKSRYNNEWVYQKDGKPIKLKYTTLMYQGRKVICTYSEKRARKDRHEREKRLIKAQYFMDNPSQLKKKASYHYLNKTGKDSYQLNEKKIKQDQMYDGFLAISTNVDNLSVVQILDQYRHLFLIEQGFRTMKSILEVRPMFHWTDKRIRGHIAMCFMALALLRHVEIRLEKNKTPLSELTILKTLDRMQSSKITQDGKDFYLRSAMDSNQQVLIDKFKLKKIKPLNYNSLTIR